MDRTNPKRPDDAGPWVSDLGVRDDHESDSIEVIVCHDPLAVREFEDALRWGGRGLLDRLDIVNIPNGRQYAYRRLAGGGRSARLALTADSARPDVPLVRAELWAGGDIPPVPPWGGSGRPAAFARLAALSEVERDEVIAAARRCDRRGYTEPEMTAERLDAIRRYVAADYRFGIRTVIEFEFRVDWAAVLECRGWRCELQGADDVRHWVEPGRSAGTSAVTGSTLNAMRFDLLRVLTTTASPFRVGIGYTKFHAFVLLEAGGDFRAAVGNLRARGFGGRSLPAWAIRPLPGRA